MSTKTAAEITEELAALYKNYQKTAQSLFREAFAAIFDKYPGLSSIGFRCYSNYFNDGDECPYRARVEYPIFNGDDDCWSEKDIPGVTKECQQEVKQLLRAFPHDVYEVMVGNHVEVTITREGVSTTDYTEHG